MTGINCKFCDETYSNEGPVGEDGAGRPIILLECTDGCGHQTTTDPKTMNELVEDEGN